MRTSRLLKEPATASCSRLRLVPLICGTIKKIAEGAAYSVPATIDNAFTLDDIKGTLRALGLARTP